MSQHPPPSLFIAIPGFGAPHIEEKRRFLKNNLQLIRNSARWRHIHLRICIYDDTPDPDPTDTAAADITEISHAPGSKVGDFLRTSVLPKDPDVAQADYILLLLDDIELQPDVSFEEIIYMKRELGINLLSPALTPDSKHVFPHMLQRKPEDRILIRTPVCEFFCYFMDTRFTYKKYHSFLSAANPWMWGMDLIMHKHMHLTVAIVNHMSMRHHYQGTYLTANAPIVFDQRRAYLAKYGETEQTVATQPAVFFTMDGPPPAPI